MKNRRILACSIAVVAAIQLPGTHAATLTWDSNAATAPNPFDGGGVWNTTGLNWWNGTTNILWTNSAADIAAFGTGGAMFNGIPGAVSFTTPITAGGLEFRPYVGNASKYNLSGGAGGTLTLAGATPTITVNTNYVRPYAAINGILAGTAGFTLQGNGGGILEIGTQANSITGGFRLDTGTLSIGGDTSLGGTGNSITFTGNSTLLTRANTTAAATRSFTIGTGVTATFDSLTGATLTVAGVIGQSGASGSLQKNGLGGLTLINTNTYTGETNIRQGTLTLDFGNAAAPSTNIINSASGLRLSGGTLLVTGKSGAVTSQTFAGLVLDPGASSLSVNSNGATSLTQNLGTITRNPGSTLNVALIDPTAPYVVTNAATNGILGGYATVSNADWATVSAGNLATFTNYQNGNDPALWMAADNVLLFGNPTANLGDVSINSLKVSAASTTTVNAANTFTLSSGGLLTNSVDPVAITGGSLRGGAGGGLIIHQHGTGALTIGSNVVNNGGATALTKSGAGTLILSGTNTYSGNTFLNAGTLEVSTDANLGTGTTVTSRAGTRLRIAGTSAFTSAKNFQFDLGANNSAAALGGAQGAIGHFIVDVTNTVGATISGAFNVTAGTFVKTGTGTLTLTNGGINNLGRLNGGLGFSVEAGGIVFDGGAASEWRYGQGEVTIGLGDNGTAGLTQPSVVTLKSGTFSNGSWTSIGRGNGTVGNASGLNVNGGTWNTGNLYTGFANGVVGYNVNPFINVTDSGIINASDSVLLSENVGANTTVTISGNGKLNSNNAFTLGGGSAAVTLNDNAAVVIGVGTIGANLVVGTTGRGLVNINSATASVSSNQLLMGTGANGSGALYNRGTLVVRAGASITNFALGNAANSYGYYLHDTTVGTAANEVGVGGAGGGNGVLEVRSGTFTANNWLTLTRSDNATVANNGMVLLSGGTLVPPNLGTQFRAASGNVGSVSYSIIDVGAGSRILGGPVGMIDLNVKANVGNQGTLTVHDGGSVQTNSIIAGNATGTAVINLNGGILVPSVNNANLLGANLDGVFIHAGGGTIDTNGLNAATTNQFLAPTGNGITSIPVINGGSGYLGRPIVNITDPTGIGATAVANFNETTGVLTGITITSPGSGYTSPVITLVGGGATAAATLDVAVLAVNSTTGGFTKTGLGTFTMNSGSSTYTGPTRLSGGALSVASLNDGGIPSAIGASTNAAANLVFDGGTLLYTGFGGSTDRNFTITTGKTGTIEVSGATSILTLSGGAAATNGNLNKVGLGTLVLSGANLHTGTTTSSAGVLAASGTFMSPFALNGGRLTAAFQQIGTLTVPALSLGTSGGVDFEFSGATSDVINITNPGGLTLGTATPLNLFEAGTTLPFTTNGNYTLFDYNTSFTGSLFGAFTIANSQAGKFYSVTNDAGTTSLRLNIADSINTVWNVDGGGSWSVATNWTAGVPNAPGALARFEGALTALGAPANIAVNGPKTVGSIVFDNFNTYNITGAPADIITVDNGFGTALINAINGTHSISAPLNLISPTSISAAGGNLLTLSGNITGGQNITLAGNGTVVLTGNNALGGPVTINAGTLEINAAAALAGSTSIVEKNGAVFRIGGAGNVTLSQPLTFDLAGAQANAISGAENGTGNFTIEVLSGTSATLSGLVSNPSGSLVKRGPGSLTLTNGGINNLANSGGIAMSVQDGSVILNGGPTAVYNVTGGELAVGDNTQNQVSLTLSSGTLNVGSWTSVGRGNGNTGLQSALNVNGGTLNTANFFTGFANGVGGYNAAPIINISGSGVVNALNTGANLAVRFGESAGSRTTVNLSGNGVLTSNGDFQVGFGGSAIMNIADTATVNVPQLGLGYGNNAAGNTGAGAIRQTGGTVQQAGTFGGDWRIGGYTGANDAQAYGSYTISGGTMTNARPFQVGAFGRGVLDIAGGTVNINGNFPVVGRFAGGVGLMNVSSGSFNQTTTANLLIIGEAGTGVVNVSGTGTLSVAGLPGGAGNGEGTGGIRIGHAAASSGTLNLNGGTVITTGLAKSVAGATSYVYLNGGTLRAGASNATFMQGLDTVVVGPNSAIFDTNGNDIAVGQPLLAPTGQGITSIAVGNAGTDYLGQPIVRITGGGGTGATAVATVSNGSVTGITITNPGTGYTSEPTIELLGGGATVPASTGSVGLAANVTTGGLTKIGAGILALNGASTYTGPTTVLAGTLGGTGTLASTVTVQSGALLAPGSGGVGTLTVAGLTLSPGALLTYEWAAGLNDQTTVTGTNGLTINGGKFNLFNAGATTIFSTNGVYNLINYTGAIGGTGVGALSVDAASQVAGKSYLFGQSGSAVTLIIGNAGVTPNFWNVNANGNWTTGTNWTLGVAPNAAQAFAAFGGGGTTITAPRTVTLDANQTVGTVSFNSAQPFTISGANTLTLNNGTDPAQITVSGGNHTLGVAMNVGGTTSAVQFTTVNAADGLTVSGPLAGNTSVTKNGPGTVTFSGAHTYSGTTTINDGVLMLSGAGKLGNVANPLAVAGGTLNLGGTTQTVGTANIAAGSITNGTLTPASVTASGGANAVISANISGATSLTKNGAAKLTLSGNNTYTGGTTVGGGTLAITTNGALGDDTSPVTFNAGGLAVEGTAATNLGNRPLNGFPEFIDVVDAGHTFSINQSAAAVVGFLKRGLGRLALSGTNTFAAPLIVNEGTLAITGGTTRDTAAGNVPVQIANAANSTATLTVSGNATLDAGTSEIYVGQGFATANATLNIQDSGTVTLNNWLAVGRGTAVGTVNMSGGTLNKFGGNGNHVTIGSVGGTGVFNQSGGVINSSDSDFFVGEVGTGTFNVSGTAVANLQILQIGVTATGTGTVNLNGGTINTTQVNKGGGGATFNFNGGTLTPVFSTPTFITDTVVTNVRAGGAIINTNGLDVTVSGNLAHDAALGATVDGGLIKRGAGTLTLTGFSSYTGPTVVETGTLAVGGSISGSTSISVRSGTTLDASLAGGLFLGIQTLGGSGTVLGNVNAAFGSKLSPGDTLGTLTLNSNLDISSAVAPDASGSLLYALGATGASDRISLTAGTLNIGTGVLGFNDFAFTTAAGFGPGTYTLFDSTLAINGSLNAANLSGMIGGFTGTLAFADSNTDLVLTVVPEPGSAVSLLAGAAALLGFRRRRRSH